jgi:hypothetical protein
VSMSAFQKFDPYAFLRRELPSRAAAPAPERVTKGLRPQTLATLATLAALPSENEICNSKKSAFEDTLDQWNKNQIQTPTPAKVAKVAKVESADPYQAAFGELERECPDLIEAERWQQAVEDGGRFLASWGEQAKALGWTVRELFGLHPVPSKPHPSFERLARYDSTGLVWLLHGRPVA